MTVAEICFVAAAVLLVVDAVPTLPVRPLRLQSLGLALVAIGLALISGLAFRLGIEGDIF